MNYSDYLGSIITQKKTPLVLGLDPVWEKIPESLKEEMFDESMPGVLIQANTTLEFCLRQMNACAPHICAVKIQMAYFEVLGSAGIMVVETLIGLAEAQGLMVIMDAKRGDIGSTCEAYAEAFIGKNPLCGDAVTVNPFLGTDGVQPFVNLCQENDRGIFVLARTSNPSSEEFQVALESSLCEKINEWGTDLIGKNGYSSVGAVVGATNGSKIKELRSKMPHVWFLVPGIGAQGGSIEDVKSIMDDQGLGVIVPVSRAALYASSEADYEAAAAQYMEGLKDSLFV